MFFSLLDTKGFPNSHAALHADARGVYSESRWRQRFGVFGPVARPNAINRFKCAASSSLG